MSVDGSGAHADRPWWDATSPRTGRGSGRLPRPGQPGGVLSSNASPAAVFDAGT